MDITELPQKIIDKYLTYKKRTDIKLISKWGDKEYKILSVRDNPYWRILFVTEIEKKKYIYKIFYDNVNNEKLKKYNIVDTFTLAVKNNYFKKTSLVKNYIKDGNRYIGYVYPMCNRVNSLRRRDTSNRLADLKYQPRAFENLYKILCAETARTKIAFTDLYYTNIVEKDKKMYLIDLDSLINLRNSTPKMIYDRYDTLPYYYKGYIIQIINSK